MTGHDGYAKVLDAIAPGVGGHGGSWGVFLGREEAFADDLVELAPRFAAFAFFFDAFTFAGVHAVRACGVVVEYGGVPAVGGVRGLAGIVFRGAGVGVRLQDVEGGSGPVGGRSASSLAFRSL